MMPCSDQANKWEAHIQNIESFLQNPACPDGMDEAQFRRLVCSASDFFILDDKLWHHRPNGCHQVIPLEEKHLTILTQAHDRLGHKGVYVVRTCILSCFWWPTLNNDVKWFVRTCHMCQTCQIHKIFIPPVVATPATLLMGSY
jgi:hypothetical protein